MWKLITCSVASLRVKWFFGICSEQVDCNEPIDVLSHKLGVHRVGAGGKEARTVFDRMSYNGKTSVVKCMYLTYLSALLYYVQCVKSALLKCNTAILICVVKTWKIWRKHRYAMSIGTVCFQWEGQAYKWKVMNLCHADCTVYTHQICLWNFFTCKQLGPDCLQECLWTGFWPRISIDATENVHSEHSCKYCLLISADTYNM